MKTTNVTNTLIANGLEIRINTINENDYISLTDIAKYHNSTSPADVIKNWLRVRSTIEFLGLWEKMQNPNFNMVEFDQFKNSAGTNSFVLSPQKWIDCTNAIGITSKSGRYGGTYAHSDIAFEFASWLSPEFKLYIIKDYQRLKQEESNTNQLDWSVKRSIAKTNYRIHTDAIKENIIPTLLSKKEISITYASEADMLNKALFGLTAKQWRDKYPTSKGNIRDSATLEQLIVLSNLETLNAEYIRNGIPQSERLKRLNIAANYQMKSLISNTTVKNIVTENK
ncbi:MAG: KilA-N domain-containing protein [Veillonella sp.]|nr:KilA-N domain-containing protein [Veillonella sp.]